MLDRSLKIAVAVTAALVLLTASPHVSEAQMGDFAPETRFVVEVRGGGAFPLGDLGDIQDPGYTGGAGLGYRVTDRITVRADGQLEVLTGSDVAGDGVALADMRLWHYTGGAEVDVLPPGDSPLSVSVNVGAGATTFDTDQFQEIVINPATDEAEADFNATYVTATGGLKFAYRVGERVDVFAGGQAYLSLADEDDTAVFNALTPAVDAGGFGNIFSVPVHGGIRVSF
jgi:hypothetical protein